MKRGYTAQVCLIQKYLDSARGIAYKYLLRNLEPAVNWRVIDFLRWLISGHKPMGLL
jgi:hypothetical protein